MYRSVYRLYVSGCTSPTSILDDQNVSESSAFQHPSILQDKNVMLWGGDVLYRSDFLEICRFVEANTTKKKILRTYGIPLLKKEILDIVEQKFDVLRLVVPTFQKDALQWLTGLSYSPKHILRMIQEVQKTSLTLEVEIPLTRPTLEHLQDSITILGQLGVSRVIVRMLEAKSSAKERYVMLAPRLGLLSSVILNSQHVAQSYHMQLHFEDLAMCVVPSIGFDSIFVINNRKDRIHAQKNGMYSPQHQNCFEETCCGIDSAYATFFGRSEFLSDIREHIDEVSYVFESEKSSKDIKRDLTWLSRHKPKKIHVWGDWSHPNGYDIIRDIQRLSIAEISLWGDFSGLMHVRDREWFRLRQITEVHAQIFGNSEEEHDRIQGVGHFQLQQSIMQKFPKAQLFFVSIQEDQRQQEELILAWEKGVFGYPLKIISNKYHMDTAIFP